VTLERGGGLEEEWRIQHNWMKTIFLLRIQNCGGSKVRREKERGKRELAEIDCRNYFLFMLLGIAAERLICAWNPVRYKAAVTGRPHRQRRIGTERERKERIMGREGQK